MTEHGTRDEGAKAARPKRARGVAAVMRHLPLLVALLATIWSALLAVGGQARAGLPDDETTPPAASPMPPVEPVGPVDDYLEALIGGTRLRVPVEYVPGFRGQIPQEWPQKNVRIFAAWSDSERKLVHASRFCGDQANNPAACRQLINIGIIPHERSLAARLRGYLTALPDREAFDRYGLTIYRKREGPTYEFVTAHYDDGELSVIGGCGCGTHPCRDPVTDGLGCTQEFVVDSMRIWYGADARRLPEWRDTKARIEALVRSFIVPPSNP